MNLMQNVRRVGLVGLVLVGSSVSAFADNIISWSTQTATGTVPVAPLTTTTVSSTSSFTGTYGTEIKGTNIQLSAPQGTSGPLGTAAYLTFDIKSTGDNANATNLNQPFEGSFSITSTIGGTVLVASTDFGATVFAHSGATSLNLNAVVGSDNGYADLTGSLVTAGNYTTPFGFDFNLYNITGLGNANSGGTPNHKTITFTAANIGTGSITGTPGTSNVPEPSTLSLLALGAAGLAFGTYRRRMASV